jgi:formylglycine-generating enzyme required for sulfatase activity
MRLLLFASALLVLLSSCDPSSSSGRSGSGPEVPALVAWSNHRGSDRYGQFADLSIGTVPLRLRYIPAGSFTMGSPAGDSPWRGDDEVPHPTAIEHGFWLAETEVTQELWQAVMGSNPSQFIDPKRPVDSVSWDDAQRFVNALHARVSGFDVRLPSEAEWEYACRAGTTTAFALDDKATPPEAASDLGWYLANANGQSHVVKAKLPNAWGLYDMHGNVQEWCQDAYAHYATHAGAQAVGGMDGTGDRVSRGGSWRLSDAAARSAARRAAGSTRGDNDQGLRLAVTAPPPSGQH